MVALKTLRVRSETHKKILDCGTLNETVDEVVTKIVDYYLANALPRKK